MLYSSLSCSLLSFIFLFFFFFFNDTAPPEIYTLSLHDALPISSWLSGFTRTAATVCPGTNLGRTVIGTDCRHVAVYAGTLSSVTSTVKMQTGREKASSPPVLTLVCLTSTITPRPSSPFRRRSLSTEPVICLSFLNMPMTLSSRSVHPCYRSSDRRPRKGRARPE